MRWTNWSFLLFVAFSMATAGGLLSIMVCWLVNVASILNGPVLRLMLCASPGAISFFVFPACAVLLRRNHPDRQLYVAMSLFFSLYLIVHFAFGEL